MIYVIEVRSETFHVKTFLVHKTQFFEVIEDIVYDHGSLMERVSRVLKLKEAHLVR